MAIIVILCGAPHLYKKDMNNSGLVYFSRRKKFKNSSDKDVTGKKFFETIDNKCDNGEFLIFYALENMDRPIKILANLYIPKGDGTTIEIDLLLVDTTSIYVIESKNSSGWIFGDEKSKNWVSASLAAIRVDSITLYAK